MNRLISALGLGAIGVAALAVATPSLIRLSNSLQPLIVVLGVIVITARVVWYLTRDRW